MSFWELTLLVAVTWLAYPIVGAISVSAAIARGLRSQDAGFSFLPELLIFPPLFLGFAAGIDFLAMPWGRRIVASVCTLMLVIGFAGSIRNLLIISRTRHVD
jgi:hypothetical protein